MSYEPLPFITDPLEAMRPGATEIHDGGNLVNGKPITLERGNVEEGFAEADRVFEDEFATPSHSGAALEPRAAIAEWDGERLTVWKSSRGIHADRMNLSLSLGIPREDVRVIGPHMGAGYGNKDETRLAAITAILARRAGKTRQDRAYEGRGVRRRSQPPRHLDQSQDGRQTRRHDYGDTRNHHHGHRRVSLPPGPASLRRAGQGALYLYRCANARYDGYLVYTNRPSAGSYRALGAPQGHFALESLIDRVAEEMDIDPLDFRLKNHVGPEGQPGERVTSTVTETVDSQPVEGGIPFSSNGLRECLERGASAIGWREPRAHQSDVPAATECAGWGWACSFTAAGPGAGPPPGCGWSVTAR